LEVLERHCEEFGRDPSNIKKTILFPFRLENDEKKAKEIRKRRGEWVLFGTKSFIIDRIQQYIDAGAEEILFGGIPAKPEPYEVIKEEIISEFN
jgi:alkanesulfonate monooxygenase SsuD/methylene tetrahydromethanopterin reductase-like flavin-dependent oxidoreductase (luciferase family)